MILAHELARVCVGRTAVRFGKRLGSSGARRTTMAVAAGSRCRAFPADGRWCSVPLAPAGSAGQRRAAAARWRHHCDCNRSGAGAHAAAGQESRACCNSSKAEARRPPPPPRPHAAWRCCAVVTGDDGSGDALADARGSGAAALSLHHPSLLSSISPPRTIQRAPPSIVSPRFRGIPRHPRHRAAARELLALLPRGEEERGERLCPAPPPLPSPASAASPPLHVSSTPSPHPRILRDGGRRSQGVSPHRCVSISGPRALAPRLGGKR